MKHFNWLLCAVVVFMLSGCLFVDLEQSKHSITPDGTVSNSSIRVINFTFSEFLQDMFENILERFTGGTEIATGAKVISAVGGLVPSGEDQVSIPIVEPTPVPETSPGSTVEVLRWHGLTNDDQPTFYGKKNFNEYRSPMRLVIKGCLEKVIEHNGVRYESGSLVIKKSEVKNRGMGVIYSKSCKSKTATVEY